MNYITNVKLISHILEIKILNNFEKDEETLKLRALLTT